MQAQYAGEPILSTKPETEAVKLLDKEYQVACTPEERDSLLHAARKLDGLMRDIRGSGNVIGLERIAIMAALNLSHDLIETQRQQLNNQSAQQVDRETLNRLQDKLEQALK